MVNLADFFSSSGEDKDSDNEYWDPIIDESDVSVDAFSGDKLSEDGMSDIEEGDAMDLVELLTKSISNEEGELAAMGLILVLHCCLNATSTR